MSNQVLDKIKDIQKELNELEVKKDLPQSQRVIASIVRLLDDSVSVDDQSLFQLFTDSDGKIRANASWFYEDSVMTDRKATYKVHPQNNLNLDIKLYGITKPSKRTIAWAQSLTPNFEDEPFNKNFNVGIDFIVPKSADRIIVVLSNNWVIRTLELKGKLTVTFQEILARWAEIKNFDNKTELHNILWESFDIQPLNKKFYSGISERFTLLRQYLVKEKVFNEKHASLFANRLLGRVIFCWFLDKKGIINPDQKYFDSESFDNDNEYYKTKLERLFFGVLNTPIGDREFKDDVTPFLNGGLFEARENDLYNDSRLSFPKNYFDDLFEFLSGYNFTTDESTSQFQQVAIDPEMLGRIFENLLAEMTEETGEQARKAKGAFYTPREIVDYMCKESLKEYLKTKIEEDEQLDQRLYQLIDAPDKDFQDQDHNWRRDWKPYKADILKALDELKVLDPACGSGAFPIGMLQLLVRVYERLEARFDSYKTKLGIIEKNIYGVDIEPMAVEISRLRAWLSIIVDEESDSKKIKPLPNLEFKFICANSLIDLDKSGNSTFGDDPELQEKLASIRDAYFNTESLNKKKKLRVEYEKLVTQGEGLFGESKKSKQLKTYRPFDNEAQAEFFDSKFMFGIDSFDLVIGNPPYIQLQKTGGRLADFYQEEDFSTFARTGDIYALFYEKGLNLTKEGSGLLCYITSNKWMRAGYGEKLRNYFSDHNPLILLDLGSNVFESATVDSNILLIQNRENQHRTKALAVKNNKSDLGSQVESEALEVSLSDSLPWFIGTPIEIALKQKIESVGLPLKDWDIKINYGIKTGLNEAFVIDGDTRKKLVSEDPRSAEIIKPILRGRDIKRYGYDWKGLYLINAHNGVKERGIKRIDIEDYPAIKRHLDQFEPKLSTRQDKGDTRYNLRNCAYIEEFEKEKVAWREMSSVPAFFIDTRGAFYCNDTVRIMTGSNLSFLLGLFNSHFFNWVFSKWYAGGSLGNKGVRYKSIFMENVPIPQITPANQILVDQVISLVNQIQCEKDLDSEADTSDLESQINKLVMDFYQLTDDEKKVIKA